jgi:hypothetical protein
MPRMDRTRRVYWGKGARSTCGNRQDQTSTRQAKEEAHGNYGDPAF